MRAGDTAVDRFAAKRLETAVGPARRDGDLRMELARPGIYGQRAKWAFRCHGHVDRDGRGVRQRARRKRECIVMLAVEKRDHAGRGRHIHLADVGQRHGEHCDILKVLGRRGKGDGRSSRFHHFARIGDEAHRFLGAYPRAARLAPSGRIEQADIHADPPAFLDGEGDHVPPFVGQRSDVSAMVAIGVDIADQRLADADVLHRLKVAGYSLPRDIVGQPVPVGGGTGALGRVFPHPRQPVRGGRRRYGNVHLGGGNGQVLRAARTG